MGLNMMKLLCLLVLSSFTFGAMVNSFSVDFYQETCPHVEDIIKEMLPSHKSSTTDDNPFPGILRLFFHDCFVEGCDGSILITTTDPKNKAERDNGINLSLDDDAFDIVVRSKKAVEEKCPGVVSCSDILAILARDAVVMTNGPHWEVEKRRRDGLISMASHAAEQLPHPTSNLTNLIELFQSKGLSVSDLVTLSGAHTIGFSHCTSFATRLAGEDSEMDPELRRELRERCGFPLISANGIVAMDARTSLRFDTSYYVEIQKRRGVLSCDDILHDAALVSRYAEDQALFFKEFAIAMQKLGRVGIKMNDEGEIRKVCSRFN